MVTITLPDGNSLDFPKKVRGFEVAEKISKSLSKTFILDSVFAHKCENKKIVKKSWKHVLNSFTI